MITSFTVISIVFSFMLKSFYHLTECRHITIPHTCNHNMLKKGELGLIKGT